MDAVTYVVVLTCAGLLSLQLLGDRSGRWIAAAQTLTPWVVPLALPGAVVAALRGEPVMATAGTAVTIAHLALIAPLLWPIAPPPAVGGDRFRVLHANLLYGNPRIADAIDTLLGVEADAVALSELTPELAAAVSASPLEDRYPHTCVHAAPKALGIGIWSRRPLRDAGLVAGCKLTSEVTIELDGRPLRFVLTHPVPPVFDVVEFERELRSIAAACPDAQAHSAYVGDFNVSHFHPPYRRLLRRLGLTDAHAALGRGLSVSWPTNMAVPPFVRLDHVAFGRRLTVTGLDDFDLPGSDHRAVLVTFAWADG